MMYILLPMCVTIIFIHIIYYVFIFNFFNLFKNKKIKNSPAVSVIVCAKNEAENLKKTLPFLVRQKYRDFEIVLINDRSYDETEDVFEEYEKKYNFIKVVTVRESEHFYGNKKYALTLGIKAATNNCLLFTDADCIPKSDFWIEEMANQYNKETQIVLGYAPYSSVKNSLINKLIRYETLMTALQYFSFAKLGTPYMGVGRNLLYSKELFLKNKGYNKHIQVMSGDDDLLINQIATKKNTEIYIAENTHMVSASKTNFKQLITQKRRHISTASYYKIKHKIILGIYAFNRILFWLVFPLTIVTTKNTKYFLFVCLFVIFKFLSEYITVGIAAYKLKEKRITPFIPLLDLFLLVFQLYIFIYNLVSKPKQWS